MLRWNLVCRIFIRNQHLWREGTGSRIGQIEKLNCCRPNKALVSPIGSSGSHMAYQSCPEWADMVEPLPPFSICHWVWAALGRVCPWVIWLFAAEAKGDVCWDKPSPEGESGWCISVSTKVHTAREWDSQRSWRRRGGSSARDWCSCISK